MPEHEDNKLTPNNGTNGLQFDPNDPIRWARPSSWKWPHVQRVLFGTQCGNDEFIV